MVRAIRQVEESLGSGEKIVSASEEDVRLKARRSLFAARRLPAGRVLEEGDFVAKRPGTGVPPAMAAQLVGKKLVKKLREGELFSLAHVGLE